MTGMTFFVTVFFNPAPSQTSCLGGRWDQEPWHQRSVRLVVRLKINVTTHEGFYLTREGQTPLANDRTECHCLMEAQWNGLAFEAWIHSMAPQGLLRLG